MREAIPATRLPPESVELRDERGRSLGRIAHPRGPRLTGLGQGTVYLTRPSGDDASNSQIVPVP